MVNNRERIMKMNERRRQMRKSRLNVIFENVLDIFKMIFNIFLHILKKIGSDGIFILSLVFIFVYLFNSVKNIPNIELPNNESQKKILIGAIFFVFVINLDKVYKKNKEKKNKEEKINKEEKKKSEL